MNPTTRSPWETLRSTDALADIAVEGAVDYFLARSVDRNPYHPEHATEHGHSWRAGWLVASCLHRVHGDEERRAA